ncbi:MAG TPA: group 1 truncated hemoglobin [Accumulibacter sp.]|uniref:group I truncated hemoglobin n=1 Tax=Accumulibacter sp. TaxID=2053492 RepID=UPI00262E3C72|nr:group 1 truncated hemoglobin [Accumulibacter sp.]MDS4053991.1 group 1 truncated hemoglobin [Accumulibacter sp.]HMV06946.1 group 1 truncated hemoglobin [Accumulibacter sp.]HMW63360.1 group 1 truncated hemoglobin [Accumulibacter sp.]HMW80244.1 group 1 truncated hemoglobin [Accumulibacter sp.]HMX69853.1 group 1 truncated hemoglobin [Accumulibacter sp.]
MRSRTGNTLTMLAAALTIGLAAPASGEEATLYKRLGGYDALAAVTDDFLGRLVQDPKLGRFFVGHSSASVNRIRGDVIDFLCVVSKGPCSYRGRDMKASHTGLKITDDDWEISLKALSATFDRFKVPAAERAEVVQAIAGLKGDIVGR